MCDPVREALIDNETRRRAGCRHRGCVITESYSSEGGGVAVTHQGRTESFRHGFPFWLWNTSPEVLRCGRDIMRWHFIYAAAMSHQNDDAASALLDKDEASA